MISLCLKLTDSSKWKMILTASERIPAKNPVYICARLGNSLFEAAFEIYGGGPTAPFLECSLRKQNKTSAYVKNNTTEQKSTAMYLKTTAPTAKN